jgi:hypothetical protein
MPDKEFLLAALRAATLRARLATNELDTVGVALKQGLVSCDDAVAWPHEINLLDHAIIGRSMLTKVSRLSVADNSALDQITIRQDRPFVLFGDLSATFNKEWLVRELLGDGDASTVYGKPGDGKSVLVEDMALHIAAGGDWHGKRVKQGAVLYIALERKSWLKRRAIAFRDN